MQKKSSRFKEFKDKVVKRSFICGIIAILVCWVMKLIGFDLFQLDLNNQFFNDMDAFFKNHEWLRHIFSTITLYIELYILTCIVQLRYGKKILLYLLFTLPFTIALKVLTTMYLDQLGNLTALIDIVYLIIVTSCFKLKRIPRSIIIILLFTVYQIISLNTRSLNLKAHDYGFVATQILSIDVYLLLYLHKEVTKMGDGTWIFFGPTAWLYSVAGFVVGTFKGHPIKYAKKYYEKGLAVEDARKTKESHAKLAEAE